jgi:hypothetical protein
MLSVVFPTSRFIEKNPSRILGDEPLLSQGGLCCSWYQNMVRGQTHIKTSKNHHNVVSEERLAHIQTIVVPLGGKLTYFVHMPLRKCFTKGMVWFLECQLIFLSMALVYCLWFYRTIRACGCLLCYLWNFWLFVLRCRTLSGYANTDGPMTGMLVKSPWWGCSGYKSTNWSMRDLIYPSSTSKLTCVKSLVTIPSAFLPPCLNDSQ